ncbi:uncharacterized protein HMPREF1541_00106 [Cyphellophora europaea CBS 101466]|uniref:Fucose-specific lectin n=1 Tax=Cyphellophora europaea (strain CBS 101466) TaxID=1220924 RepID=W2SBF2_CYPE1|nr:uncharacterized protein HMPREF1541_00106 [Cyphellophora europaea CBS 101466]ETN45925.1 hypothetical protein HMPREF1541_00106 [Cyphellophora europaea CBS 101466]
MHYIKLLTLSLSTIATCLNQPLPEAAPTKRDEGDTWSFTASSGTEYYVLIRSQNDADPANYDDNQGVTVWESALNEIAMNAGGAEIAAYNNLDDGTTLIVSGNIVDGTSWQSAATLADWGDIVSQFEYRTTQEENPDYLYLTIGTSEDTVYFFASFSLSWING